MSLRKDMTINERVFHHNINNRPSYVIHHLILLSIFITYQHVGFRLPVGILENLLALKKLLLLQVVSERGYYSSF